MVERKRFISVLVGFLLVSITFALILNIPYVVAAPSGEVEVEADNVLEVGDSEEVVVTFRNTASANVDDVASTIQFITLAAANLNPSRALIALNASWEIYESEAPPIIRVTGNVTGTYNASAIYAPYSTTDTVHLHTWALGKPASNLTAYTNSTQFVEGLRILRPGEVLKLTISVECQDVGDSRIWFFFQATEFEPTTIPVANITAIPEAKRMNLYYQDKSLPIRAVGWWPLHNSYDPYDSDIMTGHVFEQVGQSPTYGWTRTPTIRAFAKSNKLVHQKPGEDPPEDRFSFHICGVKFLDLNRDGVYDVDIEPGIDGVTITLLGADNATPAEEYYPGLNYSEPEENPLFSGENELKGSYCFNMYNVTAGTDYTFYIREELPPGTVATSPTLLGPIGLEASDDGPRESLNNHFGNAEIPPPVGGEAYPVHKISLLAPWIALATAIIVGTSLVVLRRRRA